MGSRSVADRKARTRQLGKRTVRQRVRRSKQRRRRIDGVRARIAGPFSALSDEWIDAFVDANPSDLFRL